MNVVFDFAGVVFRWHAPSLIARELPHRATTPFAAERLTAEFFQAFGGDWQEFDRGTIEVHDLVERIAARTGLGHDEVRRVVDGVPHELQPVPETLALMQRVKHAGHRLYYLSNMPAPYADHLERNHPFLQCFDDGVFSARAKMVKPDAVIYRHALQQFGAKASESVFLDDHAPNIDAARAEGLHGVLFVDAAQAERQLLALGVLPPGRGHGV
jgi:putative hydrolase of the HAD superfamily